MKRGQAIELNEALSDKGLKVKFLSGATYVSLLGVKRSLAIYIREMGESERELTADYDVKVDEIGNFHCEDKTFFEKLKLIQSKEFEAKELNFISSDEFKKFTDEVSFSTGAVLSEYLLKIE